MHASYRWSNLRAMNRLVIALFAAFVLAACSGKAKQGTTTGTGSGSGSGPAVYGKKMTLSWGIQASGPKADVFLVATDETGKAVSYPLGNYPGECKVIKPAAEMKAVTGVACANGATGTELHAVIQGGHVVVLKLRTDTGVTPDPMAREEITQVSAPPGAYIEAAP
jgi:hypothetical protein